MQGIINPQNNRIHWVSPRGRHRWVAPQEHTSMPQVERRAADLQQQVASLQQQLQDARELPRKLRRDFQQVGHTVQAHHVCTRHHSGRCCQSFLRRVPLHILLTRRGRPCSSQWSGHFAGSAESALHRTALKVAPRRRTPFFARGLHMGSAVA